MPRARRRPTTKAFAAFGDNADYSLAPGGTFESGATGWSLSGSSVGNGNETAKIHGSADAKSLAVSATGKAVSPSFCVGIQHPAFRFFARRTSGTWGVLNVKLRFKGADGVTNETTVGSVSASRHLVASHVVDRAQHRARTVEQRSIGVGSDRP